MKTNLQLIAAITSLIARSSTAGAPVATQRNDHFGQLALPEAPREFSIPRGLFTESNVPTGPQVGEFPTFSCCPLHDFMEITAEDLTLMDEISARLSIIHEKNELTLENAKKLARKFADQGRSVEEACLIASESTGKPLSLIRHEFDRREIHRNKARSHWKNNLPAT